MNKTVILSTNDNPDYLNYLPYVQKAWNKLGWETLTFYLGKSAPPESTTENKVVELWQIDGYREATIVQVSRLLGFRYCEGMVMTSDVDMMPLSNYWHPSEDKVTCYGHDLTGRGEYPICYIAGTTEQWSKLVYEQTVKEILDKLPNAKSDDFYEWWGVDQQFITSRLKLCANIQSIDREKDDGLAKGRIDRHDWNGTKNRQGIKIDAHLPRPFNKSEAEYLLKTYLDE